jgi:hypothetical protein
MTAHRSRSRIAAWLALAGMALNASWPLLANARPRVPALPSEICSATGLNHAAGGAPADSPNKNVHASHCSLCPFNAERGAAISHVAPQGLRSAPAVARVFTRSEALRPVTAFHPTAPPRAPPFLS